MKEYYYDKLLYIKTVGYQKGFSNSLHYHRYEPTPYSALEQLFDRYELKSTDQVVDFGCGKGRLNFYINYFFQSKTVGIEMNEDFYQEALKNSRQYFKKVKRKEDKVQFKCCLAEEYEIQPSDNRFYFFNPFSIQIFMVVIRNILLSQEKAERGIEIILYYPSEDYIYYLENQTSFELKKEINLADGNPNERFLIYGLTYK